jgi:hypothetical protein
VETQPVLGGAASGFPRGPRVKLEVVAVSEPNTNAPNSIELLEAATRWGLVTLATLAALGAILRVFVPGALSLPERLDQTTLLYLGVAGGLLLLRQVKTFSLGELKFEMLEKIQEQQQKQAVGLADIDLILPLLLPDSEARHIWNLFAKQTEKYQGSNSLREELRRLRSIGLIVKKPDHNIGEMRDGMRFDLADYVELTDLGRKWAARVHEIQSGEAKPPAGQPEKTQT